MRRLFYRIMRNICWIFEDIHDIFNKEYTYYPSGKWENALDNESIREELRVIMRDSVDVLKKLSRQEAGLEERVTQEFIDELRGKLEVVSGLCVGCSLVDECPFVRSDERFQSCIHYTKRVEEVS